MEDEVSYTPRGSRLYKRYLIGKVVFTDLNNTDSKTLKIAGC